MKPQWPVLLNTKRTQETTEMRANAEGYAPTNTSKGMMQVVYDVSGAQPRVKCKAWTRGQLHELRFGPDFGLVRSSMTTISNVSSYGRT